MTLSENLVMQKCRPNGSRPMPDEAMPSDYFYTVVAVWLQDGATGPRLMCALVADGSGGTNVLPFMDLEFMDVE